MPSQYICDNCNNKECVCRKCRGIENLKTTCLGIDCTFCEEDQLICREEWLIDKTSQMK